MEKLHDKEWRIFFVYGPKFDINRLHVFSLCLSRYNNINYEKRK